MKILIVSRGYPSAGDAQWGSFEKDQAIALTKLGHQVSIIYVDRRFRFSWKEFGMKRLSDNGITIYGLFLFPGVIVSKISEKLFYGVYSRLLEMVFRKLKKETGFNPDVIYAHFIRNIALSTYLQKKYAIPLVGIEHWSGLNKPKLSLGIQYLGQMAYDKADRVIAVSDSLKKLIKNHFDKDVLVVHNMIGEEFLAIQPKERVANETFHLISTGSLIHRKGFDLLIQALALVSLKNKAWDLTIIGEGKERPNLQKLIDQHRLSAQITLVGKKDKHAITELLAQSDIFIFPSRAENFSVAVLEALSAGLPVIATICGGIRECIDHTNGLLVPVEDTTRLSEAILRMFETYDSYNRLNIAENCRNQFAPHIIANQLSAIFADTQKKQ